MTGAPRIFFYVQHLLGIGHLARASRIGKAMAEAGLDVVMVTGGAPVPGFPGPEVRHIALPPIVSGDSGFSGLADAEGRPVDDAFRDRRRDRLLEAFRSVRPDLVMIEAFPFGRRQVRFELIPLLDEIASMEERPLVVTSLRDILQERTKPGRDEESVELVRRYFDRVLVHGDEQFAPLQDSFRLHAEIAAKVVYTGLVAAPPPAPAVDRYDIVVSAGGGAVGAALIEAAAEAASALPADLRWCVVTGPNLPQPDYDRIARLSGDNLALFRFRQDFPALLVNARLSVSQAGYNTVCDILRAGCHALLVPFVAGGETEQTVRAARLEKLGLATVLPEPDISAATMRQAVEAALSQPRPPAHGLDLDLDGARRTAAIVRGMIDARRGSDAGADHAGTAGAGG